MDGLNKYPNKITRFVLLRGWVYAYMLIQSDSGKKYEFMYQISWSWQSTWNLQVGMSTSQSELRNA